MYARTGFCFTLALVMGIASAKTITVAPITGVTGTLNTNTIADAIAQINAASDVDNKIMLSSIQGVHALPSQATWQFDAGKNVDITAVTGQPIVKLSGNAAGTMLTINAGDFTFDYQTETITIQV